MDEQEIYTITIVRNFGIPISFTVKRWKLIFILTFLLVFSGLLLIGLIDYFFLRLESRELSTQLEKSSARSELLSGQIARLDHDRYWINSGEKTKEITTAREEIVDQGEFLTDGIWITSRPTLSEEEFREGRFVSVESFNASINGNILRLSVKLSNSSNPPQSVGGYISITLVNNDQSPPLYQSVTEGEIGNNGFPSSFISGKPYYIKIRSSTSHFRFTLTRVDEYYTDAMVFLFSYKGTLLHRSQYSLNKSIFLE